MRVYCVGVGIGNHKLFILFLLYINLSAAYGLMLVIGGYFSCSSEGYVLYKHMCMRVAEI